MRKVIVNIIFVIYVLLEPVSSYQRPMLQQNYKLPHSK